MRRAPVGGYDRAMAGFRVPLGVFPIATESAPAFMPTRGYRLTVTAADRSPYFFEAMIPVPELFEVFRALSELLPDTVYPVLERPPEPDEDLPRWPQGRYASLGHYMRRRDVIARFEESAFQIQNDGMLGAGLAGRDDAGNFRELFIDEHKTLRFIAESREDVELVLTENAIPFVPSLLLISERPHAHRSLIAFEELQSLFPKNALAYDQVFIAIAKSLGMPTKHPVTL